MAGLPSLSFSSIAAGVWDNLVFSYRCLLLSCRGEKEKLTDVLKTTPALKELDEETAKVAGLFVGVKNMTKKITEDGKETYDMCEALQGLLEDSLNEGRSIGWNEGNKVGIKDGKKQGQSETILLLSHLYGQLKKDHRMEDLLRAVDDPEYQMQLLKEYGLLSHEEQ